MASTYNPYNSVKSISDLKGKYHTAKELGGDYEQYKTEAKQYYNDLIANGYSDVADELSANDYIGSLDILARYKPDKEFNVDNFYNNLAGIGSGEKTPATSDAVGDILESFKGTDKLLNGSLEYDDKGNVIGGLNIDHYNTGKNQLDYLNNFDYTAQPYYSSIMESYKLLGDDAAKGELASGASSNAGNIDSYAAANANRQQLSFTNAGHQAALAAAQQNQDNWMTLYNAMSGNLTDMGTINAQNLATGANYYATDSDERQNALNTAAGMYDSEAERKANQYIAELEDSTNRYNIDAETLINAANNDAEWNRLIKEIESEYNLANLNNQAALDQLDKEYTLATKYGTDDEEYTNDEIALEIYRGITAGDPDYSDITDWNKLSDYIYRATGDLEFTTNYIEDLEKKYPDLFETKQSGYNKNTEADIRSSIQALKTNTASTK